MNILGNIARFFFQKASNDFDANETFRRNQARYNALYALDPNVLVRHLEAFERGDICGLMRILEEFETREDKMRIGAFKMSAAVSSKPWEVRVNKGEEDNERAKLHQKTLTKFWNRIETTDAFCRNRKGGLRLLVKQMMSAQSRVYSVHDICWHVNGDGTLTANFTHVPAWCFENRTGRLRYIKNDGETQGEEMRDGEWLVTVGEGVGVPAAILAMAKRLSWNDWLLFSERCGMPVVVGKTPAPIGSTARAALARAIRSVAPKTGLVADLDAQMDIVSLGANGGPATYRALVDVVDRAISSLYRGGDLATVSSGPGSAGVNAQDGESELMDADGCAMVSETLRDQVERFVIRFECGDFEPLAGIVINPPAETEDIDREIKIDSHLAGLGVRLSKRDALARYGRTEAAGDEDALKAHETPLQGGLGGLANERRPKTALQTHDKALQNARKEPDGEGEGSGLPPSQIAKNRPSQQSAESGPLRPTSRPSAQSPALEAFARDNSALAEAVRAFRENPTKEAAKALKARLPGLLPRDPALAAVIAEEMASAVAKAVGGKLAQRRRDAEEIANSTDANGMEHGEPGSGHGGQFVSKGEGGGKISPKDKADKPDASGDSGSSGASGEAAREKNKIRAVKSSPVADGQAQSCGYANVKDMMAKAETVGNERIAAIQDGYSGKCKAHEAIAVISANKPFEDTEGNKVDFGSDIIEHYVEGRRRRDNMPKIENLEDLPYAIKAVKSDAYGVSRLKFPRGTAPDPLNPPRGTQREYHLQTDHGQMKVFVYIQGGHINGWHVEK